MLLAVQTADTAKSKRSVPQLFRMTPRKNLLNRVREVGLRQNCLHRCRRLNPSQALIESLIFEGEPFMIDAQTVKDRRIEIV